MCAPAGSGKRYVPSSCTSLGLKNSWSTVVTATRSFTSTVTLWNVTSSGAKLKWPGMWCGGSGTTMNPSAASAAGNRAAARNARNTIRFMRTSDLSTEVL